jgi:hypothetical protein
MARHSARDARTGKFTPRTAYEELEEMNPAPGPGPARHTGRIDTDAAYLPAGPREPLENYESAVSSDHNGLGPRARKAILIDAESGERLDDQIVKVPDTRLLSLRTFGHLDRRDD